MVWGVLLVSWLRSRNEGSLADSVGTFRRHLNVLEKAAPYRVAPANRLRGPAPIPAYRPASRIGPGAPVRTSPVRRSPVAVSLRHRQTQKRRRDVFFALLAGVVGSFLLAIIPGLSVMWSVQILFDVMFVAYVALLIRLRNLAAERELKLRFMPQPARVAPARPSYDFAAGYGDLELRRAAN